MSKLERHAESWIFRTKSRFFYFKVFFKILESEKFEVLEAKNILCRILKRDFYVSVAEINVKNDDWLRNSTVAALEEEIRQYIQSLPFNESGMEDIESPLKPSEVVVLKRNVNMGMADKNPMNTVIILLFLPRLTLGI